MLDFQSQLVFTATVHKTLRFPVDLEINCKHIKWTAIALFEDESSKEKGAIY